MEAEQERKRIDHPEEAKGLEHQRKEDAERGEDRHERRKQQRQHHDLLDPGAGAKIGAQARE